MLLYSTSKELLYNLEATTSSEAKRKWRQSIKEKWKHKCAYCGEKSEELSIDHIVPQTKGGNDHITNVCCSCVKCNRSKGHEPLESWYFRQKFFTEARYNAIISWQRQMVDDDVVLHRYKPRRNKVT